MVREILQERLVVCFKMSIFRHLTVKNSMIGNNMKDVYVSPDMTIKDVFKKLDSSASKVLLVVGSNRTLLGTITDGDVRRHLLKGGALEDAIEGVYNSNPIKVESENVE